MMSLVTTKCQSSFPFLDHLQQEMSRRFADENCVAMKGLSIIPDVMKSQYSTFNWQETLK